jgi:hypothetical protein
LYSVLLTPTPRPTRWRLGRGNPSSTSPPYIALLRLLHYVGPLLLHEGARTEVRGTEPQPQDRRATILTGNAPDFDLRIGELGEAAREVRVVVHPWLGRWLRVAGRRSGAAPDREGCIDGLNSLLGNGGAPARFVTRRRNARRLRFIIEITSDKSLLTRTRRRRLGVSRVTEQSNVDATRHYLWVGREKCVGDTPYLGLFSISSVTTPRHVVRIGRQS